MLTKHAEILDISVKQLAVLPQTIFHLLRALPLVHLSRAWRKTLGFVVLDDLSSIKLPELRMIRRAEGYGMGNLLRPVLEEFIVHDVLRFRRPEVQIAGLRGNVLQPR